MGDDYGTYYTESDLRSQRKALTFILGAWCVCALGYVVFGNKPQVGCEPSLWWLVGVAPLLIASCFVAWFVIFVLPYYMWTGHLDEIGQPIALRFKQAMVFYHSCPRTVTVATAVLCIVLWQLFGRYSYYNHGTYTRIHDHLLNRWSTVADVVCPPEQPDSP